MSDEAPTKPTLETLSKQMDDLRTEMRAGFNLISEEVTHIEKRLDILEAQLVQMDARNDRQEGLFHLIRSETLGLRADFKEFRSQFKAPA